MLRAFAAVMFTHVLLGAAFGQSTAPSPKFELADVHASARFTRDMQTVFRADRYELRGASMLDLIRTAYTIDAGYVVGGPSWLEYNRFDVIAKAPSNTPPQTLKLMLQALLADRFKLAVHKDTKPIAGFALILGSGKPKLKEASGSGSTGCQTPPSFPAPNPMTVSCRNMTMDAFAAALRGLSIGYLNAALVNSTGLKGAWDFDFKFTSKALGFGGTSALALRSDDTTVFDAVDKQLGLKLEEQKLPTPVLVVDRVNEKPTANSPDIAAKLPPLPPVEFEVATIKPTAPGVIPNPATVGFQPGGRVNLPGLPLKYLIQSAWNLNLREDIPGAPKWLDVTRFDIVGKAPADAVPAGGGLNYTDDLKMMLQALLTDRFKMKVHFEDRPVNAYTLTSSKPKLMRADPSGRTRCRLANAPGNLNAGVLLPPQLFSCQNITMGQFAEQLQSLYPGVFRYPVVDATGLEGAWDFSFTFSLGATTQSAGPFVGTSPQAGVAGVAVSDPVGGEGFLDAVEKQLGLKLEMQKRSYPVFVIDHIEEKPTDN